MKKIAFFCSLLVIVLIIASCKKSEVNHHSDFDKSYKEWLTFKETSGNSYRYSVVSGSVFGFSTQTDITIRDGKITQRHFKYTSASSVNIPADQMEWTESENEINSDQHTSAASTLTLDQVYDEARNNWLKKRDNAQTYFEAKNNGLISSCGYIMTGCQDDCFQGINIIAIVSL
ncbi:MAG TPA: hypothetical protein VIJ75_03030 [Hanamia sp.]